MICFGYLKYTKQGFDDAFCTIFYLKFVTKDNHVMSIKEKEILKRQAIKEGEENTIGTEKELSIDLIKIPADRQDVAAVYLQGTLDQALDTMDRESVNAVYIFRTTSPTTEKIYGILTPKNP